MALAIAEAVNAFTAAESASILVSCAGGDIGQLHEITGHAQANRAGPLGFARLDPGKPTIAAVNGHCFGGGFELALWCDFRIAAFVMPRSIGLRGSRSPPASQSCTDSMSRW